MLNVCLNICFDCLFFFWVSVLELLPPALWRDRIVESISGPVLICGPTPFPRRSDSGKSRLGLASRCTLSRRTASSFCPPRFYEAAVFFFFVEEVERSERNGHVCSVNETERILADVTYWLGPNAGRTEPAHWPTTGKMPPMDISVRKWRLRLSNDTQKGESFKV
jgi:hypothetical protein